MSIKTINTGPSEILSEIFSFLDCPNLGKFSTVSKKWKDLIGDPISKPQVWEGIAKGAYNEFALGNKKWAKFSGISLKKDEIEQDFKSLPKDIVKILFGPCPIWKGKKVKDTHLLVRIPKTLTVDGKIKDLTLNSLGEFAKKWIPDTENGYPFIWDDILTKLGDEKIEKSYWVMMSKDVIEGSRNKNFSEQKILIENLGKTSKIGYEVPKVLEATVCIFAEYFNSQKRLYSNKPWTYTRCQEEVDDEQLIVGGFVPAGLRIFSHYGSVNFGVAALRKF